MEEEVWIEGRPLETQRPSHPSCCGEAQKACNGVRPEGRRHLRLQRVRWDRPIPTRKVLDGFGAEFCGLAVRTKEFG